jgi:hypothetical protein
LELLPWARCACSTHPLRPAEAGGERLGLHAGWHRPSGDQADIYSLRYGQSEDEAVRLARNITLGDGRVLTFRDGAWWPTGGQLFNLGGFVPGTSELVLSYLDDDQAIVTTGRAGQEELNQIFDSDSRQVVSYLLGGDRVLLVEHEDDGVRCHLSAGGDEAVRVSRGTSCFPSNDASKLFVRDDDSGESTITVSDLDGENEVVLVDGDEGISDEIHVSADGSRLAYVETNDDQSKVVLLDTADGEMVVDSDDFLSIVGFGFPETGNALFFIGENDDGELILNVAVGDEVDEVATASAMHATFSRTGDQLVYLTADSDGRRCMSIR